MRLACPWYQAGKTGSRADFMTVNGVNPPYWEDYVLDTGEELIGFWRGHLAERKRNVLFVTGKGFDPRMCLGLETLLGLGGEGKRDILAVSLDEGAASPSTAHLPHVEENWKRLLTASEGRGTITTKTIRMQSDEGRRIGSRGAAFLFEGESDIADYDDVVVDISALPRGIYFPLIAKLLHVLQRPARAQGPAKNLHVLVSESPELDECIAEEGVADSAAYVHGFSSGLEMEATTEIPEVWIPLLGERQASQLRRVYDLVLPNEICPLLPSPSLKPRRGDDLIYEYRELLFERLRIEPSNIVYAAERNPFEVYRQIKKVVQQFREALKPLGGCKVVVSAHSSKLLSVGALLAAYEVRLTSGDVGIAHVESQGYTMPETLPETRPDLFSLWLAGECYEA